MKQSLHIFLVTILWVLVSTNTVYADFYAAADISYKCKGNYKYDVTFVIYAECGTPSRLSDLTLISGYDLFITSDSLKITNDKFSVLKTGNPAGQEINLFCERIQTKCKNTASPDRGVRKYTFVGELDLSKYPRSRDWKIYWRRDTRSVYQTNLVQPEREPYYVEATLNNKDFECNSSPSFASDAVLTSCISQNNNYPLLATDNIDNDRLVYSIVKPKSNVGAELIYKSGFSQVRPLQLTSDLRISTTGVLTFNPIKDKDVGLTDILIEEFRDGKKVGSITRGIQINSFNCLNNKPSITGFGKGRDTTLAYCVGDTITPLRSQVSASDIDVDNKVLIRVKSGPDWYSGTNVYDKTPTAFINGLITTDQMVGVNTFVLEAVDDGCPVVQSVTKTFTIVVSPKPSFDLGEFKIQNCVPGRTLSAIVTPASNAPFTYTWFSYIDSAGLFVNKKTLATTPTYVTPSIGSYALRVRDKNGCSFTDTTSIREGLFAAASTDFRCLGDTTEFYDRSSSIGSLITKVEWFYGLNNATGEGDTTRFFYPKVGEYTVKHRVTNAAGCKDSITGIVEICSPPKPNFSIIDSCLQSPNYIDISNYTGIRCRNDSIWYIADSVFSNSLNKWVKVRDYATNLVADSALIATNFTNSPSVQNPWPSLSFDYDRNGTVDQIDTGLYKIRMRLITQAGCLVDTVKVFPIFTEPKVTITALDTSININPFFAVNCTDPDSVLFTKVSHRNQNKGKNYFWYKYNLNELNLPTGDPIRLGNDSIEVASGKGWYILRFEDGRGCDDTAQVIIVDQLLPDFTYRAVCYPDSFMTLVNTSDLGQTNATFKKFRWDFFEKDASIAFDSIITTTKTNITYKFPERKDYDVVLTAFDNTNCNKQVRKTVYNTSFKDNFNIIPDFRTKSICSNDQITGLSVLPLTGGNHIDTIFWDFGDGVGRRTYSFTEGQSVNFAYLDDNLYTVKMKIKYNSHLSEGIAGCETQLPNWSQEIGVKPEFSGTFFPFRKCISDTSVFLYVKNPLVGDSTVKIKSIKWIITPRNDAFFIDKLNPSIPSGTPTIEQNGFEFTHYFTTNELSSSNFSTQLYAWYKAEDENGCVKANNEPVDINTPLFPVVQKIDTACFNNPTSITFISSGLAVVDTDWGVERGDSTLATGPLTSYSSPVTVSAIMPESGNNGIEIYLVQKTKLNVAVKFNGKPLSQSECRGVVDTTIYVRPAPEFDFTNSEVCAGADSISFLNNSKIKTITPILKDTTILSWSWDFGDGNTSTKKSPKHLYTTGGVKKVTLTAKTASCQFTVSKDVYVKPSPKADFYFDSIAAEAGTEIKFENKTLDNNIVSNNWSFGDGTSTTTSTISDVFHTYTTVNRFPVVLKVTNDLGCTDTIVKIVDTDARLDLPTAFSPNNDGTNDLLPLIYKLIPELLEFKIYNRWGQLVFDGGTDLTSKWNGKFNGTDQEMGVYVAHVKAKGKYDKTFNFKRNVTLIR